MDNKFFRLQQQLFQKDLLIQQLKTQLEKLQNFKHQVSLALHDLPQEDNQASVQVYNNSKAIKNMTECGICLLEILGWYFFNTLQVLIC